MRSVCDLLVFKTPFEEIDIFNDKIRKIEEMLEDYIENAGINLTKTFKLNQYYKTTIFSNTEAGIEIQCSKVISYNSQNYFPSLIINYYLNTTKFEKENIEYFINDNIKLVGNVFFDDFFIDYDNNYSINDINKGKKVDFKNLKKIDLTNLNSKENKNFLDSSMYIYFNLLKNIFDINNNAIELDNLVNNKTLADINNNALLFKTRGFETKNNLIKSAQEVKLHIDSFIKIIS